MMQSFWLFLLPVAAATGWFAARMHQKKEEYDSKKPLLSRDYLLGLNFLLNEEPDKALDVFLKMLDVDSETVETHLALGNLFRRRGEVNRAIRIHQNLIARPTLDREIKGQALFALAKDYLSAGVLDRAERLFQELVDLGEQSNESLDCLLGIYQQEKDWLKAIQTAQKLDSHSHRDMRLFTAHYYCELAEAAMHEAHFDQATKFLKRAMANDKQCVRASLLLAQVAMTEKHYKQAIRCLKRIKEQDADYFSEAIIPLVDCYRALSKEKELILYFKDVLKEFPKIPIAVMLSEQIRQWRGDKVAASFVTDYVRKHPSVAGLHRLVELHLPLIDGKAKQDLLILHALTERLLEDQPTYQCVNCGFSGKHLHWQCPSCKRWNSVKPTHVFDES